MSFCPSCGRGVVAGAQFCASCGASLQGPITPHAAPPPAYAPPAYAPPGYAPPAYAPQPMIVARVRPTGVAILAILQFISAGFLGLAGFVLAFGGSAFAAAMSSTNNDFATLMGGGIGAVFVIIGVICLVGAALAALLGRGIWMGRSWARILSLVFAWIGLVSGVLGAIGALMDDPGVALIQLLFTGIYAFLVWYWTRPGVKAFFASDAPIQ